MYYPMILTNLVATAKKMPSLSTYPALIYTISTKSSKKFPAHVLQDY